MEDDYSSWTSCQVYGHVFEDFDGEPRDTCRDCPEQRETEED
jgi:hypothetical protein